MIFLWILLVAVFTWRLTRYHWSRRYLYLTAWKLDGPISLPIIGSMLPFIFCKTEDILQKIHEIIKKYDNPVKFWLGPHLLIVVKEPQQLEKIMSSSKCSQKHKIYNLMKIFLGEGLITASGNTYKVHKKIIQPFLSLDFSEMCISIFEQHIQICCERLEEIGNDFFDIGHKIHLCTADIIGDAVLGYQFNSQNGENMNYIDAFTDIYKIVFARMTQLWLHPEVIFNISGLGKEHKRITALSNKLKQIVTKKSYERRNSKTKNTTIPIIDLFSEYMDHNPETISSDDFWSHLITLYIASQDTIAIISSAACLCLGMYPEYQAKLIQEIHEVLGKSPQHLRPSDIAKLPYLDMCVKDVLRLFPIGGYIFRKILEDQRIEKLFFPKNSGICIPIYSIHKDPKYWENPDHFHPDHFLPDVERKRPVYSYLPFSAGPRGCIGKVFANVSVKVILINLLQRYEIEAQGKLPDVKFTMDISVRSLHGYKVRIKRRNS